jgi:hypothetical protein
VVATADARREAMKHKDPGTCLDDIGALVVYGLATTIAGIALVGWLVWVFWRD